MIKPLVNSLALAALLLAAGCASLEPTLPVVKAEIPANWPQQPANEATRENEATADIGWRDFFLDPKLEELVVRTLHNNRDLRVAVLNVDRARALYRIQRADRFPSVGANVTVNRGSGNALTPGSLYSASLGLAAFEIDLFGRVNNLSEAALQQYFSEEQGQRSVQLSLVAEVANAYLALAADIESQRVAQATLNNQQLAFNLIEKRHQLGAVSGLDLSQARTLVETARVDVARFAGLVETDTNALTLLVGAPIEPALLPQGFHLATTGLGALPAQLPSEVLLRRPDVRQAELVLGARNANIGAARAAFFPSISLTGSIGSASTELSGLFDGSTKIWSFVPQLNVPIFQGGRLRANLGVAMAERDIALARYEKAIQTGFKEVADALTLTRTLAEQRQAQEALLDAARRTQALSQARYDRGRDSYLILLDAQRTLYAAEQGVITAQLAEQANRVMLYKVLGGGWEETTQ